MKTTRGHNYSNLLNIMVTDNRITVNKGYQQLAFDITPEMVTTMIPAITAKIQAGVKPAATLQKQLERIELHREQMLDAYEELFRCYRQMTEPQTRVSSVDKTRHKMLDDILDMKVLRAMCRIYLDEDSDSFVLPDEKVALITATVAAMRLADTSTQSKS